MPTVHPLNHSNSANGFPFTSLFVIINLGETHTVCIIIIIIIIYKIYIASYTVGKKIAVRRFTNNIKSKTVLHEQSEYVNRFAACYVPEKH